MLAPQRAFALAVLDADQRAAAAIGDLGAHQATDLDFAAVAHFIDAAAHRQLQALEVVAQADVGDAGQRVRAVHRRSAAGDDFHARHGDGGDGVQVHRHAGVFRHAAVAIDEGERTAGAQAAQVHVGRARHHDADDAGVVGQQRAVRGVARAAAAIHAIGALQRGHRGGGHAGAACHELRQVIQGFFHGNEGTVLDLLLIDGNQRAVADHVLADDARAGDLHLLKDHLLGILRGGFGVRGPHLRDPRRDDCCAEDRRNGGAYTITFTTNLVRHSSNPRLLFRPRVLAGFLGRVGHPLSCESAPECGAKAIPPRHFGGHA